MKEKRRCPDEQRLFCRWYSWDILRFSAKEIAVMKKVLILVLAAVSGLSACGAEKGIEVHQAWMRQTLQGENGAVYFVIHNHSSESDELIGASSDVAEIIEIHESKMDGDVMKMQQLQSVPMEAYAEIKFEPGGLHLMLVDLKKEVQVGDQIEIILHFKNFEELRVRVSVRDTPAPEEDH
jgi:copper(I)-binding protein